MAGRSWRPEAQSDVPVTVQRERRRASLGYYGEAGGLRFVPALGGLHILLLLLAAPQELGRRWAGSHCLVTPEGAQHDGRLFLQRSNATEVSQSDHSRATTLRSRGPWPPAAARIPARRQWPSAVPALAPAPAPAHLPLVTAAHGPHRSQLVCEKNTTQTPWLPTLPRIKTFPSRPAHCPRRCARLEPPSTAHAPLLLPPHVPTTRTTFRPSPRPLHLQSQTRSA